MHPRAIAVLEHWLGPEGKRNAPAPDVRQRWFTKSPEYDAWLARELGVDVDHAMRGDYDGWADEPRCRVALIILLDQLTRNLRRGSPRMFDNDRKALELARQGVERGEDKALRGAERYFLYMPFMHSESIEDQDRAVELFGVLVKDFPELDGAQWATKHRDVIARFGRFPHRNVLLDRTCTSDELLFLQQPGSSF